jgi:hypothetical protein
MVDRQADKIECRQGSRMVGIASDLHVVGGKRASRIRHDNTTNYALDEVSREGVSGFGGYVAARCGEIRLWLE